MGILTKETKASSVAIPITTRYHRCGTETVYRIQIQNFLVRCVFCRTSRTYSFLLQAEFALHGAATEKQKQTRQAQARSIGLLVTLEIHPGSTAHICGVGLNSAHQGTQPAHGACAANMKQQQPLSCLGSRNRSYFPEMSVAMMAGHGRVYAGSYFSQP